MFEALEEGWKCKLRRRETRRAKIGSYRNHCTGEENVKTVKTYRSWTYSAMANSWRKENEGLMKMLPLWLTLYIPHPTRWYSTSHSEEERKPGWRREEQLASDEKILISVADPETCNLREMRRKKREIHLWRHYLRRSDKASRKCDYWRREKRGWSITPCL